MEDEQRSASSARAGSKDTPDVALLHVRSPCSGRMDTTSPGYKGKSKSVIDERRFKLAMIIASIALTSASRMITKGFREVLMGLDSRMLYLPNYETI